MLLNCPRNVALLLLLTAVLFTHLPVGAANKLYRGNFDPNLFTYNPYNPKSIFDKDSPAMKRAKKRQEFWKRLEEVRKNPQLAAQGPINVYEMKTPWEKFKERIHIPFFTAKKEEAPPSKTVQTGLPAPAVLEAEEPFSNMTIRISSPTAPQQVIHVGP